MSPPPGMWRRLLAMLLRTGDRDSVLGDLEEEHALRARRDGAGRARGWYRRQVLRSAFPFLFARLTLEKEGEGMIRIGWDRMLQDIRHALRIMWRNPGFSAVIVLTLGVGIGAATAVYTVVEGVLLRPLPYQDPERLFKVGEDGDQGSYWMSAPNFQDLESGLTSFTGMAAYSPGGANLMAEGEPTRIATAEVTADFFDVLGVEPAVGRAFTEEERLAGEAVVVVSHGLWQRQLGGRPEALGSTLVLDGRAREVVGILPPLPAFPAGTEAWTPLSTDSPEWRTQRGIDWLQVVGRLAPDADLATARSEADAVGARLRETYPDVDARLQVGLLGLEESLVGNVSTELRVLMAAVLLVLLVTGINVGGLLLARASARQGEVLVRSALGCSRPRLAFQFLVESSVLAALGCGLGIVLARVGVDGLLATAPADMPRVGEVGMDGSVLLFALASGGLAALLMGVLPALQSLGERSAKPRGDGRHGHGGARLRDGLVVVQVALALALLTGAGLVGKSFWRLQQVDPGFQAASVLAAGLPVVESDFPSGKERALYLEGLLDAATALPGVRSAALTNSPPFVNSGPFFDYQLSGVPTPPDQQLLARYRVVTPSLFETLGIPLLQGRTFTEEEARGEGEQVAVVSESLVRAHFPNGDALGREIRIAGELQHIVGVVGDIRDLTLRAPSPFPHVYVPAAPVTRQSMTLLLRSDGDPTFLLPEVRRVVHGIAPAQPITPARPLADFMSDSVSRSRFTLSLLSFFAGSTVLLASLGLYGLLSWVVGRRTREIGVRLALGARARSVAGGVVLQGLRLTCVGLVLGLLLAFWMGGLLDSLLYQVDARDPWVMTGVGAILLLTAWGSAWIPARRATQIAPSQALRVD